MTKQLELSNGLDLATLKRQWVEDAKEGFKSNEGEAFWLLRQLGEFTVDEFHHLHPLIPKPLNNNWYGVLFAGLSRMNLIHKVGYRPSTRPEANGRVVAVWRVIWQAGDVGDKNNLSTASA